MADRGHRAAWAARESTPPVLTIVRLSVLPLSTPPLSQDYALGIIILLGIYEMSSS